MEDPRPETYLGPILPMDNAFVDHWTWDRDKSAKSHEVRLYGQKATFHPRWSNATAGVRGTRILNNGRYYWEVNVSNRVFGTSMMFGIGTKNARLHANAFVNMLGETADSWGLSHKGILWHNGDHRRYTDSFKENTATTIGIYFDGLAGTLTYYKDGVNLGEAFNGLEKVQEPLYPIICSTAAKTEMTLGVTIQDRLNHENQIEQLELPDTLKKLCISEGPSEESQEDWLFVDWAKVKKGIDL